MTPTQSVADANSEGQTEVRRYVQNHYGLHVENGTELVLASDYDTLKATYAIAREAAGLAGNYQRELAQARREVAERRVELEGLREALALAESYMSANGFQPDYDHYNMVRRMVRAALAQSTSGAKPSVVKEQG